MIFLEISAAEGIRRTTSGVVRPLLAGSDAAEKYRSLMSERVPLYRRAATLRINTNRRNPGAVVRYLASRLESSTGTRQARRRRRPPWRLAPAPAKKCGTDSADQGPAAPPTPATPAAMAARRAEARK